MCENSTLMIDSGSFLPRNWASTYLPPNPAQLSSALYMHSVSLILMGGVTFTVVFLRGTARKRLGNRALHGRSSYWCQRNENCFCWYI